MESHQHILAIIESVFDTLTDAEQTIAHYFLTQIPDELSATFITNKLHISIASLTRFAQKCGFQGYREFAYEYQRQLKQKNQQFSTLHHGLTKRVLSDYNELLSKTYSLIDEGQVEQISQRLETAKRVYFYGLGLSGLVAQEMKIRFMRLGVICEAVTDSHMLQWMDNVVDRHCLVIAVSLSAQTTSILQAVKQAREKGAYTILMSHQKRLIDDLADELLLVASTRHLSYGNRISPQFPLLVVVDLLYAFFMANNQIEKEKRFNRTIIHSLSENSSE